MQLKCTVRIFAVFISMTTQIHLAAAKESIFAENAEQLYRAVDLVNKGEVNNIIIANGNYHIPNRLTILADNVTLSGAGASSESVVINGNGMTQSTYVNVIFDISGSNVKIENLTLQNVSNHLIQLRAENNADNVHLSNVRLLNSYEQMIKVSGGSGPDLPTSDNGIIENCLFEYTEGVGPQYYIGGIDAHRAHNWIVKNNTFKNIASPNQHIAEHAVHFWNFSKNNTVINNTIINSDRGIGFGMGDKAHQNEGGIIANNTIIHDNPKHPFADVGIILESSPGTVVRDNYILINHDYPNAIEYRYPATKNVKIEHNYTNRRIAARDGATATLVNNDEVSWAEGAWLWVKHIVKLTLK